MSEQKDNYQLLIEKLDHFTRKYYLNQVIRGFLYSLGFILLFFLLVNLLEDQFYFNKTGRKILFFSFLGSSVAALTYWVFTPLLHYFRLGKQISQEQAAAIIGQHFEGVKDKLINILQLKKAATTADGRELIFASINQKSEDIKLVPFRSAIDLSKNRKYLKYALPPLMILLVLLIAAPSMITKSTHRLLHSNQEFEREAPFHFNIQNKQLEVIQYDDYTLEVGIEGEVLPSEVFIEMDDYVYRLKKNAPNSFSYQFNNVQKDIPFKVFSGDIYSDAQHLSIIKKPVIIDFQLALDYPAYTRRKDETVSNIGDIIVPVGSKVSWSFNTENTEGIQMRFVNNADAVDLDRKGADAFSFEKRIYRPGTYQLTVSNQNLPNADSVQYAIQIIPDQYPNIDVEQFVDSVDENLIYFVGNAADDYGLKAINFVYRITSENGKEGPLKSTNLTNPTNASASYQYTWDVNTLQLKPGDNLTYYFEAYDNDGIQGSKSSKTQVFKINKATKEELEDQAETNSESIKDELKKSLLESKKLQEDVKKLREKLLQKKELGWEEKKELEKLMERQKELEKMMKEAKEKFEENQKNQEQLTPPSEEILQKQEKVNELFEELMSEEMKSLMEEIQELMQELQKDEALEMMQQFEFKDNELEMELDRMLELYKQLEVEQMMQEQIEKLEELAEEQEALSEETKESEKEMDEMDEGEKEARQEELEEKQEDINEEFEKIEEEIEKMEEKNEELEHPKDLDTQEEKQEEISEELEKSSEQLEKKENKKASKSQKQAAEKMQEMAQQMSQQMQSAEMEQMEEDMQALRQLLENLIGLSFDQEDLFKNISGVSINTPRYINLVQQQHKLKGDFQLIQDSLQELSKRVMQIESFVTEKIASVNENMQLGLERLEERQVSPATDNQQRIMTNVNDLALMLNEAMEQMQQQMSGMMSGQQMCDNPGNKSGGKPSDKITKASEQMGEQMKKMRDAMKEGKGGVSSEQFAKMAAKQAAMRKLLREAQQEKSEQGKGSKELEQLQNELNKIEIDLVNKTLTNEMLKRQQNIETRLLEAEKAERMRGEEEKRKAEVGKNKPRELPPSLQEYIRKREAEIDNYKLVSPDVKPYYKQLIDEYINTLKSK